MKPRSLTESSGTLILIFLILILLAARGARLFRDGEPRGAWRLPRDAWMPGAGLELPQFFVGALDYCSSSSLASK
jgi:hypothetical protein